MFMISVVITLVTCAIFVALYIFIMNQIRSSFSDDEKPVEIDTQGASTLMR